MSALLAKSITLTVWDQVVLASALKQEIAELEAVSVPGIARDLKIEELARLKDLLGRVVGQVAV